MYLQRLKYLRQVRTKISSTGKKYKIYKQYIMSLFLYIKYNKTTIKKDNNNNNVI